MKVEVNGETCSCDEVYAHEIMFKGRKYRFLSFRKNVVVAKLQFILTWLFGDPLFEEVAEENC